MKSLKKFTLLTIITLFALQTFTFARELELLPITPFWSKSADVEKLLGKPKTTGKWDNGSTSYFYYLKNYNFKVHFASGNCNSEGVRRNWNVTKDTVISVEYILGDDGFKFSKLKIDRSKFIKEHFTGHVPSHYYYFNEADGIEYKGEGNLIYSVTYFPSSKFDYLKCKTTENFY